MKAILFDQPGGPEVLYVGTTPRPVAGPGELLVKVHATALNRADTLQRKGQYPPPPGESTILGLELSGEVVEVGLGVTRWKPGDKVCGLVGGGGYAEYAILRADMAFEIPSGYSWAQAAAIPEAFLTAWQCLRWITRLQKGEHVLIHAGASGVGSAAIQLARELGAVVWVTASASKHAFCTTLGAHKCIDYHAEDFAEVLGGAAVDVVVDCIGGTYFQKNLHVLRMDGRMVLLAMMGGAQVPEVDLRPVLGKRLMIQGSTLRNRSMDYKAALCEDLHTFAWPLFEEGVLRSIVDRIFNFEEVVAAHQYMEENRNQGKIILQLS